ncbi:MAG TPA: DUF6438 domain-containing protein [Nevskiaceae bacterium]
MALLVALAGGLSGCSTLSHWWDGLFPLPPQPELDFTRVMLRRTGCLRSRCPRYEVVVHGDGRVWYDGWHDVAVHGRHVGRANPPAMTKLRILLARNELYWMAGRYTPMRDHCRHWAPDGSMAIIELRSTAFDKHIVHYSGCYGAPPLLAEIENAIDAAAGDGRWVRGNLGADAGVKADGNSS